MQADDGSVATSLSPLLAQGWSNRQVPVWILHSILLRSLPAFAQTLKVMHISEDYVIVYQPAGDVFPGPAAPPLEAGRWARPMIIALYEMKRDGHGEGLCG